MAGQTLTALVHGEAGHGKSWLCDTSPPPRLVLDAEGRAKYLPSQPKIIWDPRTQAPPAAPTQEAYWETCIAIVPDFATMDFVFRVLQGGQHPFRSVCVDSLMEIQKRLIDDVAGIDQLKTQDWGTVLRKLEKLVRDYRDLVLVPTNVTDCVIFTAGSRVNEKGKMAPILQGQMAATVPYFFDVCGYLYKEYDIETQQIKRNLLIEDVGTAVAKDGTDRLVKQYGFVVPDPNLWSIFESLNGQNTVQTQEPGVQYPTADPIQGGTVV